MRWLRAGRRYCGWGAGMSRESLERIARAVFGIFLLWLGIVLVVSLAHVL